MNKKTPLYYSIMETIKDSIINGVYPINSLLPTETEFEKIFNVSKITIRKAIDLLEKDGYVSKQSGKGTTVISNSIFNKLCLLFCWDIPFRIAGYTNRTTRSGKRIRI